ncbi:ATP-binding cassette domain-containing protein [Sediminibacterium sp. KACHI17]|uniref:ATP-binding cassette domain-containing protein n=1 Tax=Sediminibacterium sp. KACHI17 TaxID=1751071 RepID=A0AAT9GL80_9BACT
MILSLHNVVPLPLKDKVQLQGSDIWNRTVSFTAGQWTKIKAPSGTGKTTLIHSLYKLREDYSGKIEWDGVSLQQLPAEQLSRYRQEKISIVFQDLRLFPNLTSFENIELKRVLQKPYCDREKIFSMAEELGVQHILQQKASICSYGEQQRVAIIRALIHPFSMLVMDEPFSHLDQTNTAKAAALIMKECKDRNAGFIITDLDDDHHFPYDQILNL